MHEHDWVECAGTHFTMMRAFKFCTICAKEVLIDNEQVLREGVE